MLTCELFSRSVCLFWLPMAFHVLPCSDESHHSNRGPVGGERLPRSFRTGFGCRYAISGNKDPRVACLGQDLSVLTGAELISEDVLAIACGRCHQPSSECDLSFHSVRTPVANWMKPLIRPCWAPRNLSQLQRCDKKIRGLRPGFLLRKDDTIILDGAGEQACSANSKRLQRKQSLVLCEADIQSRCEQIQAAIEALVQRSGYISFCSVIQRYSIGLVDSWTPVLLRLEDGGGGCLACFCRLRVCT